VEREQNRKFRLARMIGFCEEAAYYGVALVLVGTIGLVFYSTALGFSDIAEVGTLQTAFAVLERVLLIFILAELLGTVGTIVREHEVTAEPFLLIGLIAVVRRVLSVTVEIERSVGTEEFGDLILELGVLTALVISLAVALRLARSGRRSRSQGRTAE
jgi:uncharacterized membrane protein (DUF373 family)